MFNKIKQVTNLTALILIIDLASLSVLAAEIKKAAKERLEAAFFKNLAVLLLTMYNCLHTFAGVKFRLTTEADFNTFNRLALAGNK